MTEDGGETGPDEVPLLAQPDGPHLQPAVGVSEGELESLQFSVSCLVLTNRTNHPNNLCPALTVVSSPASWSSSNIQECGELSSLTHLHT